MKYSDAVSILAELDTIIHKSNISSEDKNKIMNQVSKLVSIVEGSWKTMKFFDNTAKVYKNKGDDTSLLISKLMIASRDRLAAGLDERDYFKE